MIFVNAADMERDGVEEFFYIKVFFVLFLECEYYRVGIPGLQRDVKFFKLSVPAVLCSLSQARHFFS